MGTLQAALAGNGIYGERDFMLWDSSMTEKDGKAQDVFLRQALLSGQRVPILFGKSCVMSNEVFYPSNTFSWSENQYPGLR